MLPPKGPASRNLIIEVSTIEHTTDVYRGTAVHGLTSMLLEDIVEAMRTLKLLLATCLAKSELIGQKIMAAFKYHA